MDRDHALLFRCLQLARLGDNRVYPNPRVGCVIASPHRILAEGFHAFAGGPHAEVAAANALTEAGRRELADATLYVSLEPCNHYGKTPPCTDLILRHGIPRVWVGCLDANPLVAGKGIARLREAGVEVHLAENPAPFEALNRWFFVNQQEKRPYVTLKWAESANGKIAGIDPDGNPYPVNISGNAARAFTHQLRARHQAIMVGRRTAEIDDPSLDTRFFPGSSPLRVVLDRENRLSSQLRIFRQETSPTLVLNEFLAKQVGHVSWLRLSPWPDPAEILQALYDRAGITSILVEGGANWHRQLISGYHFDELFVLVGQQRIAQGLDAPTIPAKHLKKMNVSIGGDTIYQVSHIA